MEWGEAIELVQSKDCGRFAVATRPIHAGEQVLLTAPYTLTFNPNMYISAIHLNAKASSALSNANVASSAKCKKQHDKPKGKNKNVKHSNCNKENEDLTQQHSPTVKNVAHTDFEHCNYNTVAANTGDVMNKENKRTTMTTFCTCCFKEIPANTEIANASQLEQIAQDMSVERDCLWHDKIDTQIMKEISSEQNVNDNLYSTNTLPDKETNTSATEASRCNPEECNCDNNMESRSKHNSSHKQEWEQQEEEQEEEEEEYEEEKWQQAPSHHHQYRSNNKSYDKTYNKLKKPSRSAKMKSDAAVALKEHLQEQAMERRAESIRRYVKAKKERLASYVANTEHIKMEWIELMTSHEQCVHHLQNTVNANCEKEVSSDYVDKNKCDINHNTSSELSSLSSYYNLECKAEVVKLYLRLKEIENANKKSKINCTQSATTNEEECKGDDDVDDYNEEKVSTRKVLHDRTTLCEFNTLSRLILIGCPCCGIACFCSWRCWFRQCRRHMQSGECALLRRLYFLLMEFYYTTPQSANRANHHHHHQQQKKNKQNEQRHRCYPQKHNNYNNNGRNDDHYGFSDYGNEPFSVQPIGSEPASWNTNINAERALEAQCILQVSQVLVQSALEGYRGSWDCTYAKKMSKYEQAQEKEKVLTLHGHNFTSTCKSDCNTLVNEENLEEIHGTVGKKDDKLKECSECHSERHNYHDEKNDEDDNDMDLMDASVAHSLNKSRNACNTKTANSEHHHNEDNIAKKMVRHIECLTPLTEYLSPSSFSVESDEGTKRSSSNNNNNHNKYLVKKPLTLTPTTSNHVHVHVPRYVDLACLVSNMNKMPKEHGRLFGRYYRTFYKHFQHIVLDVINTLTKHHIPVDNKICHDNNNDKYINVIEEELENLHITKVEGEYINDVKYHSDTTETKVVLDSNSDNDIEKRSDEDEEEEDEEETVSEEFFSRLGATAQCNSFGVYTSSGESIAFGFYPFASYFNHSCNPNLCRAMYEYGFQCAGFYALRDIAANEPLTICYIDVEEENSAIRRQQLMASYRFHCGCERCAGSVPLSSSTAHHMELCTNCHIHGYMRPRWCLESQVTSTATTNHNCEIDTAEGHTKTGMQIKECTVCRRRILQTNDSNNK